MLLLCLSGSQSCSHTCQVLTAVLLNSQVVNDVMLCLGSCLHRQGQAYQENIFFPALLEPEDKGTTVLRTSNLEISLVCDLLQNLKYLRRNNHQKSGYKLVFHYCTYYRSDLTEAYTVYSLCQSNNTDGTSGEMHSHSKQQ